nr:reverse transcriptase domain-containing protein [Tanacetum cinerariifolium]
MPPRVMTRSAGRPAAASLGGGIGVRVGRGGRGRRPREGNDKCVNNLNGQVNDQGMGANEGIEGVNGNVEGANEEAPNFSTIIAQQLQNLLPTMLAQVGNQNGNMVNEKVRNVLVNGNQVGCSYKEFLACNPKEYDEFCPSHEMQKLETELWNHPMVGAGHAAYTDRFHELARNGLIKKVEKKGNVGEPSKDKNGKDDNKRTRTGNVFATTVSLVGRENIGVCLGM